MKILTKIWEKLRNEAGTPVLHFIDKQREPFIPIRKIAKTPQIKHLVRCLSGSFDVISFRIE
jgi:hypothetical protein